MMLGSLPVWPFRGSKPHTTLCIPIGMHIEKVVLVQQALETKEQPAMRRKSNKRVVGTCSYTHGQYCYKMYLHVWSIRYNMYVHA